MTRRTLGLAAAVLIAAAGTAHGEDACRKVLVARIKACADTCIERAKAAVAPELRERIRGYGCVSNCTKLEMFNGHTCPR